MVLVFSYGSNSIVQLQARVHNTGLKAFPARAPGWKRIFCRNTTRWCGAAASLAPNADGSVHGAVVDLTRDELERLDAFESGYDQVDIQIEMFRGDQWTGNVSAKVYISRETQWLHPPSEQYLTAIHVMLREQFQTIQPDHAEQIDVCGIIADKVEKVYTWRYPGAMHLSLPALCVEVNALRAEKWVMPQSIADIQTELQRVGVQSTPQLAVWLVRNSSAPGTITVASLPGKDVVVRDGSSGDSSGRFMVLDDEALGLFRHLLQLDA